MLEYSGKHDFQLHTPFFKLMQMIDNACLLVFSTLSSGVATYITWYQRSILYASSEIIATIYLTTVTLVAATKSQYGGHWLNTLLVGLALAHQAIFSFVWIYHTLLDTAFERIAGSAPSWDTPDLLRATRAFLAVSVIEIVLLGIVIYRTW
jgi:hypothetical protein